MTKLKTNQDYQVEPQQEQTPAYQCYQAFLYNFPNRYKLLDQVKRYGVVEENELTDKTIYLSEKAKKILRVILKMIFRSNKAVVNQNYLNKLTKCCARQNKRLLNELLDLIQYEKIKVWKGRNFSYYFCIKLSASLQQEIRSVELKNTNYSWTKMSTPICNNRDSSKEEYRSNARAHESKFLNNSNSSNSLSESVKTIDANTATCENVETTVKAVSKKKFKFNARKKPTAAERKASRAKVYKFNQYEEPKSLADHYPLSSEDAYELQKRSGKQYNLNAMNEILLDMSRKPKESKCMFESKALFMSYMTKVYQNEDRDVNKTNLPGFKIMKRRPVAEVTEITTLAQREKYLNETENSAIYARCDYTQYRARIAGQFPINLAYDLLTNMVEVKKEENVLKITMHKLVPLGDNYAQLLLQHAKGIGGYAGVDELVFKALSI